MYSAVIAAKDANIPSAQDTTQDNKMTTKHKPSPILQGVLKRLIESAMENQGEAVQHRCTNNLQIDLRIMGGVAILLISRSSVYPSETEWRTVLRHMPFKLDIPYSTLIRNKRHWFRGRWVLQQEMTLHSDRSESQPAHIHLS